MNIWLWIAQGLLATVYLWVGGTKAFRTGKASESMKFTQGRSDTFIRFIGISEMLGGFGLVLPLEQRGIRVLGRRAAVGAEERDQLVLARRRVPGGLHTHVRL